MPKNSNYNSKNRSKHYLKYHLIFVCSIGEVNPDTIKQYIKRRIRLLCFICI